MQTSFTPPLLRRYFLLASFLLTASLAIAGPGALEDLVGSWVRPDGGYKLVVKSVAADGQAVVEYFNPSPIHVSEAHATIKDGVPILDVKFDDVNYTGSTYHLTLSPDKKRLDGKYYQAVQKQTYEIFFER